VFIRTFIKEDNPRDVHSPIQEYEQLEGVFQSVRKLDNPGAVYPLTQETGDFWRCIYKLSNCQRYLFIQLGKWRMLEVFNLPDIWSILELDQSGHWDTLKTF
jgi:hypothetical protein